jgi:hypothetical protein
MAIGVVFLGAAADAEVHVAPIAPDGWARNSVNTTIFRQHSVTSHDGTQVVGYYDDQQRVVLAKRQLGTDDWQVHVTQYTGNAGDAHNGINLAFDGEGYLHVAWDHHNHPLRYARSTEPLSLELGEKMPMIGSAEESLSYPQFFNLPDGRLLFMYRDGSSGNGNLVINRYDPAAGQWQRIHDVLIDGEGQRNAYWQAAVDARGRVHVAWVWRETWDVATNHDLAYARSDDAGDTWVNSRGEPYSIPINASTSEYALRIPQQHELINQTTIAADAEGRPYIVTYFRADDSDVPQYWLIHHDGSAWQHQQVGERTQAFSLSGGGTKRIPISRPQVAISPTPAPPESPESTIHVIYRDAERGSKVSLATCSDLTAGQWTVEDLTEESVGQWEPSYDRVLWQRDGKLHIYVQKVEQADAEGLAGAEATPVSVLQWEPEPSQ